MPAPAHLGLEHRPGFQRQLSAEFVGVEAGPGDRPRWLGGESDSSNRAQRLELLFLAVIPHPEVVGPVTFALRPYRPFVGGRH